MSIALTRRPATDRISSDFVIAFDYSSLDESSRESVRRHTAAIHSLHRGMATAAVEIGRHLIAVRKKMTDGTWLKWLRAEFRYNQPVASNLMSIARRFGDLDCLDNFQPSALYALAREKVSPMARRKAIAIARSGELVGHKKARDLIHEHADDGELTAPDGRNRFRSLVRSMMKDLDQDDREILCHTLTRDLEKIVEEFEAAG